MKNLFSLFVLISFTLSPALLLAEEESDPHIVVAEEPPADDSDADDSYHLGIQERGRFISLSIGLMRQPLPVDRFPVWAPNFNMGFHRVDEAIVQIYEFHLGITASSKLLEAVYGIGFGPRKGLWHVGLAAGLGYLRAYDEEIEEKIHGLHYRIGPLFSFTVPSLKPEQFRFHAGLGWAALAVSTPSFRAKHPGGLYLELGVAFSIY